MVEHEKYPGDPFFCKQILYLVVGCPSDCSVKTLGLNIAVAIDKAIGNSYAKQLTNDICTSVFFVGTPIAEGLFTSQEHLKRRTRGMRLLPFKPDGTYRAFLQAIWPYQLTPATAPLSEQLANKRYDHSSGIPAYIVKIFQETVSASVWRL